MAYVLAELPYLIVVLNDLKASLSDFTLLAFSLGFLFYPSCNCNVREISLFEQCWTFQTPFHPQTQHCWLRFPIGSPTLGHRSWLSRGSPPASSFRWNPGLAPPKAPRSNSSGPSITSIEASLVNADLLSHRLPPSRSCQGAARQALYSTTEPWPFPGS